jgi:hypothetical protein
MHDVRGFFLTDESFRAFGFMEYKKHPELPRLLPEGTLYCREVKVVSVFELRTGK